MGSIWRILYKNIEEISNISKKRRFPLLHNLIACNIAYIGKKRNALKRPSFTFWYRRISVLGEFPLLLGTGCNCAQFSIQADAHRQNVAKELQDGHNSQLCSFYLSHFTQLHKSILQIDLCRSIWQIDLCKWKQFVLESNFFGRLNWQQPVID